jgi:putative hydrolase of the HAD superfamily
VSEEVGCAKPDAGIFLAACRGLGELPADCLFIGDDPQNDLAGATAAGLRARLVGAVLNPDALDQLLEAAR